MTNTEKESKSFAGGTGDASSKALSAKVLSAKKRIWEIDFLRGFCVLLMVFDHIQYDFGDLFGGRGGLWANSAAYAGSTLERICQNAVKYLNSSLREAVHPIVIFLFVFLSGISSGFARSNLGRGAKLAVVAALLTAATAILNTIISGTIIRFGVLHMLSAAMLLYGGAEWLLKKLIEERDNETSKEIYKTLSIMILAAIGLLLILLGSKYNNEIPYKGTDIGAWFFYSRDFHKTSADYFPILPYAGYMFLGAVFGKIFYSAKKGFLPEKLNGKFNKYTAPVTFTGKNAIWFYIAHQPVVFGLIYLIGLLAGMGG